MARFYAGIGSRQTPPEVLQCMVALGTYLAKLGWTLRSGGAKGADKAFEAGCNAGDGEKEIFLPKKAPEWAYKEAEYHIPENRPPFQTWKPYVQGLIARNMQQVLGENGDQPVEFVVCWAQADVKDGGGTGYAMRCADARGIPIFNMHEMSYESVARAIKAIHDS